MTRERTEKLASATAGSIMHAFFYDLKGERAKTTHEGLRKIIHGLLTRIESDRRIGALRAHTRKAHAADRKARKAAPLG